MEVGAAGEQAGRVAPNAAIHCTHFIVILEDLLVQWTLKIKHITLTIQCISNVCESHLMFICSQMNFSHANKNTIKTYCFWFFVFLFWEIYYTNSEEENDVHEHDDCQTWNRRQEQHVKQIKAIRNIFYLAGELDESCSYILPLWSYLLFDIRES